MCRWLAYSGSPIRLEELLVKRDRSLIDQSLHARQGATPTNGDGFGVGWYEERKGRGSIGARIRRGTTATCRGSPTRQGWSSQSRSANFQVRGTRFRSRMWGSWSRAPTS
jgi:hypothetical protein